jgi:hypothetical protein
MVEITEDNMEQEKAKAFLDKMSDYTSGHHPEMTNPLVNPNNDNTDAGKSNVKMNMPQAANPLKM